MTVTRPQDSYVCFLAPATSQAKVQVGPSSQQLTHGFSPNWSATVLGAVIHGLQMGPRVVSNVASSRYGLPAKQTFDAISHAGQRVVHDERLGPLVTAMVWYVHKGSDLLRTDSIEFTFFRCFPESPTDEQLLVMDILYKFKDEPAPRFPSHGLKENCRLPTDLSTVPRSLFSRKWKRKHDGTIIRWWELTYQLVLRVAGGPMFFGLECNGTYYYTVEPTFVEDQDGKLVLSDS